LPSRLGAEERPTVVGHDREEEHASRLEWASIIRHEIIPPQIHIAYE